MVQDSNPPPLELRPESSVEVLLLLLQQWFEQFLNRLELLLC